MLPWIFAVLLLLNLLLFAWGMLGEPQGERPLPPVPDGQYQIQLLAEVSEPEQTAGGEGGDESAPAVFTPVPAPSSPDIPDGASMRHTETALGRALVPVPDEADARPAIPTVRLTVDGEELPADGGDRSPVDSKAPPAGETAGPLAAEDEQAQDLDDHESRVPTEDESSPNEPATEPPVRLPLPDPEPPVPGDEDTPREGAV